MTVDSRVPPTSPGFWDKGDQDHNPMAFKSERNAREMAAERSRQTLEQNHVFTSQTTLNSEQNEAVGSTCTECSRMIHRKSSSSNEALSRMSTGRSVSLNAHEEIVKKSPPVTKRPGFSKQLSTLLEVESPELTTKIEQKTFCSLEEMKCFVNFAKKLTKSDFKRLYGDIVHLKISFDDEAIKTRQNQPHFHISQVYELLGEHLCGSLVIDLNGSKCSNDDFVCLIQGIGMCTKITSLVLDLHDTCMNDRAFITLMSEFNSMENLRKVRVNISNQFISHQAFEHIRNGLESHVYDSGFDLDIVTSDCNLDLVPRIEDCFKECGYEVSVNGKGLVKA